MKGGDLLKKNGGAERRGANSKPVSLGDRLFCCKKLKVFIDINNSVLKYAYIS